MADFWAKEGGKHFEPPGNYLDYISILSGGLSGRVLDIGCNRAWLAGLVDDYFGIEISENALLEAKEFWSGRLTDSSSDVGPRFQVCNAEDLPFPSNSFDCVFAKDVLEHSLNPIKMFSEFRRVLRPEGIIYLSTPDAQRWVWHDPTHVRPYTYYAHRALENSFGLENVCSSFECVLPGTQHLARLFGNRSPWFVKLLARFSLCPRNVVSVMRKKH